MLEPRKFKEAIKYEGRVSRRLFLAYNAALASLPLLQRAAWSESRPVYRNDPFSLGVASGDPDPQSVVLWTRLAPMPLEPDGGMPGHAVKVRWEIADDESFGRVVHQGETVATPQLGHSVHVTVNGLEPDRWYWYRFSSGDAVSPIGRTRTLPAVEQLPDRLKFAVTSCQNFEQGLFTAYQQMARDGVDLVFHLGDYIYEYEAGRNGKVRTHLGKEIKSLGDYRVRHAQYRSDQDLAKMHATCPWFVTWDDHEFDNNYANDISEENGISPQEFLTRRANAYQAYYEMMPLRISSMPRGPHLQLYRKSAFGRLAAFFVLDTRQYRTDQPNNDGRRELNDSAMDAANSLLGQRQKNWLKRSLLRSQSTWNVLAQQVMMGMVGYTKGVDEPRYHSMDQWPGYTAERMEMMRFMADRRVSNPVVLTGDIHSNWANELRIDDRKPEADTVGVEFVATSLSSGGNGSQRATDHDRLLATNPCVKFHNRERGYLLCEVDQAVWSTDYKVIDDVLKPGGKTFSRAKYIVESGQASIQSS